MSSLSDKTLVMVVGPAAIGKSSLMHAVTQVDTRFGYVRSFTTRPARGDGMSTYRHISFDEASELKRTAAAITFLTHPTTGHIYGTDDESYGASINLLDTLSSSVELYRSLPFKRSIVISLTASPDTWQSWLYKRYPQPSLERRSRLTEAVQSIEWSLGQTENHYWLVNHPDRLRSTAERLIELIDRPHTNSAVPVEARALLDRAKLLLSYEQGKE